MSKKNGEKKKGPKIPKRVGSFKVPKELRRKGEQLIEQAQTPAGRAAIAQGLSVVAGLAASVAKAAAAKAEAKPPVAKAADAPAPSPPADAVAQAVGAGVEAVLGRLFPRK